MSKVKSEETASISEAPLDVTAMKIMMMTRTAPAAAVPSVTRQRILASLTSQVSHVSMLTGVHSDVTVLHLTSLAT